MKSNDAPGKSSWKNISWSSFTLTSNKFATLRPTTIEPPNKFPHPLQNLHMPTPHMYNPSSPSRHPYPKSLTSTPKQLTQDTHKAPDPIRTYSTLYSTPIHKDPHTQIICIPQHHKKLNTHHTLQPNIVNTPSVEPPMKTSSY